VLSALIALESVAAERMGDWGAFNLVLVSDVSVARQSAEVPLVNFFLDFSSMLVINVLNDEFFSAETLLANIAFELFSFFFNAVLQTVLLEFFSEQGVILRVTDRLRTLS